MAALAVGIGWLLVPLVAPAVLPADAAVAARITHRSPELRDPAGGSGAGHWICPLEGPIGLVRPFAPPARDWNPGHRGVDLVGSPGAQVRAAGAGTVHWAGTLAGRGVVSIEHPQGLITTYEPVTPAVVRGQAVAAGDPIGLLEPGHADCPGDACLHWGLRSGTDYLDPMALLSVVRVRLLPVGS